MNSKTDYKILILGIGNDILTDDAIGPKLVNHLKTNLSHKEFSFHIAAVGGMEIIEFICGFNTVIIIDAIRTKDGIPGTVYHLTPEDFKETLHLSSFHDMNFLTALEFARRMDIQLPEQIDIIAIEIVEDLTFSNDFSPVISRKYKQICKEVSRLVTELIRS